MIGSLDRLVLLRRFTALVGANDFTTLPQDVAAYSTGTVRLWRGVLQGTSSPTFRVYIETSADGITWVSQYAPGYDPGANASVSITIDPAQRWLRAKVTLTGTDPAVTCWCSGMMEHRVR